MSSLLLLLVCLGIIILPAATRFVVVASLSVAEITTCHFRLEGVDSYDGGGGVCCVMLHVHALLLFSRVSF